MMRISDMLLRNLIDVAMSIDQHGKLIGLGRPHQELLTKAIHCCGVSWVSKNCDFECTSLSKNDENTSSSSLKSRVSLSRHVRLNVGRVIKKATLRMHICIEMICTSFGLVLLRLNVPVNNFSVMSGRSHHFLGITSSFRGVNVSCSRTQHGGGRSRIPRPLAPEYEALPLGHGAPPY